ncbi:hypothetical protein SAMN05444274_10617 [Mariniphaga anaerophila]|uniref:Secreted protein n=1 Tax=Mariniphaga anaerophila TaxID=1484053 RepID=A0A1M5C9U5_9BACT|nr:hypothetical protein [Mariniphaga anaerophila]SHF51534.1 hypothetical protein SAMN05444274_10617 [Mariniphaga anaerophila]
MNRLIIAIATVAFWSQSFNVSAQTETTNHDVAISIPEVALVGIAGADGEGTTINLTPEISNLEAGEKVDFGTASNSTLWLNYTSVIKSLGNGNEKAGGKTRKIRAELNENLPNGLELYLEVAPISSGSGQTGAAEQEKVLLKKGPSTVVDNIGSCYTEKGEGKGHRLTYTLGTKKNQFDKVMAQSFSVQVVYTITEN